MNLEALTPRMWEVIRTWDYNTLVNASQMFQPIEDEEEEY